MRTKKRRTNRRKCTWCGAIKNTTKLRGCYVCNSCKRHKTHTPQKRRAPRTQTITTEKGPRPRRLNRGTYRLLFILMGVVAGLLLGGLFL